MIIPPRGNGIVVPKSSESRMVNGHDVLMFMYQSLGIEEYKDYFGLIYCDERNGNMKRLKDHQNLRKLAPAMRNGIVTLFLQVVSTFHPENPDELFQSSASRQLFCDLMKEELTKGELGCDVDTHAYIDAMYIQAVLGKSYHFLVLFIPCADFRECRECST